MAAALRAAEKENEKLSARLAAQKVNELLASAKQLDGVKIITARLENMGNDAVRSMADKIRDLAPDAVAVFANINGGQVTFAATCGKDAVAKGVLAGKLVSAVAAGRRQRRSLPWRQGRRQTRLCNGRRKGRFNGEQGFGGSRRICRRHDKIIYRVQGRLAPTGNKRKAV